MRGYSRPQRPWREALKPEEVAEIARLDKVIASLDDARSAAARERHAIQCRASNRAAQRADSRAIRERRVT